jgi:putative ABC transport system permease protein
MKLPLWRRRREEELEEEIQSHLHMAIRDRMERGESAEEAELAARREFGNVGLIKETARGMWGFAWLETIWHDARYGARMLWRNSGFTLVAVFALALGISVNTAVFTYVNAVLFRALTFVEPERVAFVWAINHARGNNQEPVSAPEFREWREQSRSFESLAAVTETSRALTGAGEPERVSSAAVTANYFQMLGVEPFRGRWFLPDEEAAGASRVAVLNYNFWQRRFGADLNALQQTILLDGERYTVVGIASRNGEQPMVTADLWEPLILDPKQSDRSQRNLMAIGRLKRDVTVEQANAEMESITARISQQFPETNSGWRARVRAAPDVYLGAEGRIAVALLIAVVFCVLLIACFNVAGMQLARALARQKEIALRLALGAGRWRLIRQLLIENLLIALLGGATGVLLALWGMNVLHVRYAATSPFLNQAKVDARVLAITLALSLLSAILCGLTPGWQATKPDLHETLKEGGRSIASGGGNRIRNVLVVAEISLALVLLIVGGLMIRSIIAFQTIEPGFNPDNLLTMRVSLPEHDYAGEQQRRDFFARALGQVAARPGVKSVGAINSLPLTGGSGNPTRSIVIEGRQPDPSGQQPWARNLITTPDYFEAIGIPLLSGRLLSAQDSANSQPAALISQTMAGKYWPNADPVGRRIRIEEAADAPWINIVGVVGDVRNDDVDAPPLPQIYLPYAQHPARDMSLVIRTAGEPLSVVPAVRDVVWTIDRNLPVYEVYSMRRLFFNDLSSTHLMVELLGAFALLSLLLAAVGVYGIVAYSVSQRTQEIGVRMALGAQTSDVTRLFLKQGLKLAGIGVVIGLSVSLAMTRLIKSIIFGVSATDTFTFLATTLLLSLVTLLACWIPARRATKVDPMIALRCE